MFQSVLKLNEAVNRVKRCHKECLVFKVDYKKIYYSVSWDVLLYMLSSLSLFFLSVYKIPYGVARKIRSMQICFLWGKKRRREK